MLWFLLFALVWYPTAGYVMRRMKCEPTADYVLMWAGSPALVVVFLVLGGLVLVTVGVIGLLSVVAWAFSGGWAKPFWTWRRL